MQNPLEQRIINPGHPAMDMRFHWIRDQVEQGQIEVNWEPGISNRGDYFTKHFSAAHHSRERPNYLHIASSQPQALLTLLRGCVETPAVLPGSGSPSVHQTLPCLDHVPMTALSTNGYLHSNRPIATK
jgi:hypothetical protein